MGIQVCRETAVKRLFFTLFVSFLASLLLFIAILMTVSVFGFRRSSSGWGDEQRKIVEQKVIQILKEVLPLEGGEKADRLGARLSALLPPSISIAVYDRDKTVLYLHSAQRGMGRRRMSDSHMMSGDIHTLPLEPVRVRGTLYGYYRIGSAGFGSDIANLRFLQSMRKTVWFGIAAALALSVVLALVLSRRLSGSAQEVAHAINRMAQGDLSVRISEKGVREIALIAHSANELGNKLEREEGLRQQWTADIAHDLRTPLSALKSQLEGMHDGVLEKTPARILRALQELSRIEALVSDLGELTRLESPEMRISPQTVKTTEFLEELKNRFSHQIDKKSITAHWDGTTKAFYGDEQLLLRAMSNFISNALRHTPLGGSIRVGITQTGSARTFFVFNSGDPVPAEELPKVFDRLFRGEYARTSPGTGLGLTIAKKIVELHGGTVSIESSENQGTTVRMTIPS
jgi:two-component system sensor histidine kinase BaeS